MFDNENIYNVQHYFKEVLSEPIVYYVCSYAEMIVIEE